MRSHFMALALATLLTMHVIAAPISLLKLKELEDVAYDLGPLQLDLERYNHTDVDFEVAAGNVDLEIGSEGGKPRFDLDTSPDEKEDEAFTLDRRQEEIDYDVGPVELGVQQYNDTNVDFDAEVGNVDLEIGFEDGKPRFDLDTSLDEKEDEASTLDRRQPREGQSMVLGTSQEHYECHLASDLASDLASLPEPHK
ncbi:hypothetical protein LTR66_008045 [Elasticomyces elasticus]|nr:hypothetical protein LTR66_008045 [Elasticomyces elasticus]